MSGVVGVFAIGGSRIPCEPYLVEMAQCITCESDISLPFSDHRLGLQAGVNPSLDQSTFYCHDSGAFVWLHGSFDNKVQLLSRIASDGADSRNEAELLLRLYQSKGLLTVPMLRGRFAAIIWDPQEHRFIMIRDPLGLKTLYFRHDGDNLWFASSQKALLVHQQASLDLMALNNLMHTGSPGADRTLFQKVESLRPGEILLVEKGRIRRSRYWQYLWEESYEKPTGAQLQRVLGASVDRTLNQIGKMPLMVADPQESTHLLEYFLRTQSRYSPAVIDPEIEQLDFVQLVKFWGNPIHQLESLPWIIALYSVGLHSSGQSMNLAISAGEDLLFGYHPLMKQHRWSQRQQSHEHVFQFISQHYYGLRSFFNQDLLELWQNFHVEQHLVPEAVSWSGQEQLVAQLVESYLQPMAAGLSEAALNAGSRVFMPHLDLDVVDWLCAQHPRYHVRGVAGGQLLKQAYGSILDEVPSNYQPLNLTTPYSKLNLWPLIWPSCCTLLQSQDFACELLDFIPVNQLVQHCRQERGHVNVQDQRALVFLASFSVWYRTAFKS